MERERSESDSFKVQKVERDESDTIEKEGTNLMEELVRISYAPKTIFKFEGIVGKIDDSLMFIFSMVHSIMFDGI